MHKRTKVLAIGAHADDIEFYAGGSLLLNRDKIELVMVIATDGRHGHDGSKRGAQIVEERKQEQQRAAEILGAKETIHMGFEDSRLEYVVREYKQRLLEIINSFEPDLIYTFDPEKQHSLHEDYHPDHRVIAEASLDVILIDATLPSLGGKNKNRAKIFLYNPKAINYRVKIEQVWNQKRDLLTCFESQKAVIENQANFLKKVENFFCY